MTARQRGTGAGIVLGKSPTAETLRATAARLLAEPVFKDTANRISDALSIAGGAPNSSDMIEEFIKIKVNP